MEGGSPRPPLELARLAGQAARPGGGFIFCRLREPFRLSADERL